MPLKQKHLEGLVSLACGVGAATIGAAAVAGAVPGLGPAIALLSSLWNPLTEGGKKLVESVSESTLQRGWRAVHAQLSGAPGQEFPSNHDLLRAVRESWLLGLAYCLKKCRADVQTHPDEFDAANVMAQLNEAMRWIDSEVAACKRSDYFAMADRQETADQTLPFRRELDILGQRVADVRNPQEAGLLYGHLFEVATLAAIAELADQLPSPLLQPLRDWILGRNERH